MYNNNRKCIIIRHVCNVKCKLRNQFLLRNKLPKGSTKIIVEFNNVIGSGKRCLCTPENLKLSKECGYF